jgi:hypothetical protein
MRYLIVTLIAVLALIVATDAYPHSAILVVHPKGHTLRAIAASQKVNIKHNRYVCRHGGGWNQIRSCKALVWLKREYNETEVKLHPRVSAASHWKGWSCITHGPNFNDTGYHEGNGYNGSYTGPLGMSTPWAGYYPPTGDWVTTPVATVYAIAERVAAANHFRYSWMAGQWPQTFPPCAGYFN